ncbi:MAG: hypothetical protein A2751_04650 [Candidatus Doudnabacteria bacterium RIFCSPHIGHO2_01_FULL_46_14]|uniref:Glycosyltransferase n=1 Tax=Candidatus Doudnabacteria bacterium RIFCSPHIGHO2_01_FULL_46_14 TaxID=1817824 RepID=A0A1F5NP01_9BACT|nr:MAG: hypothetical protein A2751_04650 [Candidatus Doudnabacteria bacterium RIFCSPHIGHO2_01_FULL_46_14]
MKIDVLGVGVNADTKNTIIFLIKKLLTEQQRIFIVTPYSEMIVRAQKDNGFRDILNSATFSLPDGIGVLWAAHYLSLFPSPVPGRDQGRGRKLLKLIASLLAIIFNPQSLRSPIPEKISGSDFIWDLTKLAVDRGHSVFLLGGFGNTADLAADKLKSKFPNLKIAGTFSPPKSSTSSPLRGEDKGGGDIIERINSSQADFLFVALGPVAQEKWIAENLPKLKVKLAIGLGGTFDYMASKVPLAPQIWRNLGLEWLWRLLTQPWRVVRVSKGVLGLIWYCVKARV